MATKKQTTATKKELAVMHFQTPEMLCEWVNKNEVTPHSIVTFDRFHAVYFYKK
jgi:stringent starvation protein B